VTSYSTLGNLAFIIYDIFAYLFIEKLESSVFLTANHRPVVSEINVVGRNHYFLKENRILKIINSAVE